MILNFIYSEEMRFRELGIGTKLHSSQVKG